MKKNSLLQSRAVSILVCSLLLSTACSVRTGTRPEEKIPQEISVQEVRRVETVLASDDMRGRRAGTPDIDKAAAFVADEFKKSGIQPLQGNSYLQEFSMIRPKQTALKVSADNSNVDPKNVVVITGNELLEVDQKSGFNIVQISKGENLQQRARSMMNEKKNAVVFVDTSFSANFSRLANMKRQLFRPQHSLVFILGRQPASFKVEARHTFDETKYANVVGILPGKLRKNEYVIFSAHYDHIGVGRPVNGDSIYNGANDDAAGTTAVIALANHFSRIKDNERTLVFAAFTAEEVGGFGSQYFSQQFKPEEVVAMFNIEMIGTDSKWGKNSAYITGFNMTNMGDILQNNLKGTAFTFHPDPYPSQQLFYRSDNATLARLGVPAHTISTAKMDAEPHYHKPSDEIATLDMENMTAIIKAIAASSRTIVSGKDTPSRVKAENMNRQ